MVITAFIDGENPLHAVISTCCFKWFGALLSEVELSY